jgi:hypothetical protein
MAASWQGYDVPEPNRHKRQQSPFQYASLPPVSHTLQRAASAMMKQASWTQRCSFDSRRCQWNEQACEWRRL